MTRYEAFIGKDWRAAGMTQLVVARLRADGRAEIAFFLLDLWCLGVKDAFLIEDTSTAEFQKIVAERLPEEYRERFHPACAKKLVEGAVAYAENLGFAPHRDYRKARRPLGGLDAGDCPELFTYGRDGKPCYIEGPHDTPERTERVLAILKARLGEDGFRYIVTADDIESDTDDADEDLPAGDDEEADADDAREALLIFFDDESEAGPTFFEFCGMLTALHVCPTVVMPSKVLEKLWGPAGYDWQGKEEMADFLSDLQVYWNYLAGVVAACAETPDAYPKVDPIDIFEEDFDDPADTAQAIVQWAHGFMRATREWPKAWGDALKRADLAPHWRLVEAWSDPDKPESLAIITAREGTEAEPARAKDLPLAVIALICALRPKR